MHLQYIIKVRESQYFQAFEALFVKLKHTLFIVRNTDKRFYEMIMFSDGKEYHN